MVVLGPQEGHHQIGPEQELGHDGQGHQGGASPDGISGEGHDLLANPGRLLKGRRGQLTALNRKDI